MKKTVLSFRVEPELINKIDKQAKKEERTRGNLVQLAIKKYLESVKKDQYGGGF